MSNYAPPFRNTSKIVKLVSSISEALGRVSERQRDLKLRKINKLKTIQGTLAIEGNTLSLKGTSKKQL